jgi:very-short-patch-repair endonuclease
VDPEKRRRVKPKTLAAARRLRREMTPAEEVLWFHMRAGQMAGLRFRRQHPIGSFVVDFYCPAAKLIVEIDGDTHDGTEEYDASRTEWLVSQGFEVIRFTNDDVHGNLSAVLDQILAVCERRSLPPP